MSDSPSRTLNRPDIREVPELTTRNEATGVSDHASDRYRLRATNGGKIAVRRAWAAGGELDPERMGCDVAPDAARYDPLTQTVLVARNGAITTVIDASGPTLRSDIADELNRRGYL